uniref:RGS domain-containing protein n=1 Tax=Caenorhabditis tropicalis TaxID=1561998 RepID=A0A1I7V2M6_9PELO
MGSFLSWLFCGTARPVVTEITPPVEKKEPVALDPQELLTREEWEKWSISLKNVLDSRLGRRHFRKHLEKEHSECNLSFWEAVNAFRAEGYPSRREIMAHKIVNEFIEIETSHNISLSKPALDSVMKNMSPVNIHTFDEAQKEVFKLMKGDSYQRFLRSDYYKGLMPETITQQPV